MSDTGSVSSRAVEDSGGLGGDSSPGGLDVAALIERKGWSRARVIVELRRVAAEEGVALPGDDSLRRMIRLWVSGARRPSEFYEELLGRAFGVVRGPEEPGEFEELLDRGSVVDTELVVSLEGHTAHMRLLDRRLGSARVLPQVEEHARVVADLVRWAPVGPVRSSLAAAGAEASALAGWLALDLGRPAESWRLHGRARALAHESDDAAVMAHVTTQQAYAALDAGHQGRAVEQVAAARETAGTAVPPALRAWLAAAEAEMRAAGGDRESTARLLDLAQSFSLTGDVPPYLVLNEAHLARWAGHSLARVGDRGAIEQLVRALEGVDPRQFARASASLHVDLAVAFAVSGDRDARQHHAGRAAQLSRQTGSYRQRARAHALLDAEGQEVQERDERS